MAFCGYCGSQMPDDMSFCTECGKPLIRKPDSTKKEESEVQYFDEVVSDLLVGHDDQNERAEEKAEDSFDRWTMSDIPQSNSDSDDLYNSLKNTNVKKEKAEKKKIIIPLIFTLLFLAAAITFYVIKFKPFEKFINDKNDAVAESGELEEETDDRVSNSEPEKPGSVSTAVETEKEPEVTDCDFCYRPINQWDNKIYMDYYFEVYNPNTSVIIGNPNITLNLRTESNAIVASEKTGIGLIMPGETAYIFGTISMTRSEYDAFNYDEYLIEWSYETDSYFYAPIRRSQISISNVTVKGDGYDVKITGEVINSSSYDADKLPKMYGFFYKGDELVAIASSFLDTLYAGSTRAFEFTPLQYIPDYDTVNL